MAKILTTVGNSFHIEEIIKNADKILTFVTPFLKLSNNLIERIQDADKKGVQITLIYGKSELLKSEKDKLLKLTNIEVYFYQNLHAKCYFNENEMIITSMNLYEFSERNNREMGILLNEDDDKLLYDDAIREVQSIINTSVKDLDYSKKKENNSQSIIYKLNPEYNGSYTFYLPSLKGILEDKYPHVWAKLSDACLEIKHFPRVGIDLEITGIAVFHFIDNDELQKFKLKSRDKIRNLLPDLRIFWNYSRIQIYQEKGFKEEISDKGLLDMLERYTKIIDVFYQELK